MKNKEFIIGMSGASGAPYAFCLIAQLLKMGQVVHLVLTDAAWRVLKEEHNFPMERREQFLLQLFQDFSGDLILYNNKDIGASIASGSHRSRAMIVIPCSMGTLAKIAVGLSSKLLERAADVMLKERRRLIIVPRETPFSSIHLNNMLQLSQMGVVILPAMPGFYTNATCVEDMVRFVAGKTMDALDLEHNLYQPWEGGKSISAATEHFALARFPI